MIARQFGCSKMLATAHTPTLVFIDKRKPFIPCMTTADLLTTYTPSAHLFSCFLAVVSSPVLVIAAICGLVSFWVSLAPIVRVLKGLRAIRSIVFLASLACAFKIICMPFLAAAAVALVVPVSAFWIALLPSFRVLSDLDSSALWVTVIGATSRSIDLVSVIPLPFGAVCTAAFLACAGTSVSSNLVYLELSNGFYLRTFVAFLCAFRCRNTIGSSPSRPSL